MTNLRQGLVLTTLLLSACEAGQQVDHEVLNLPVWSADENLRIGSLDDPDYALTTIGPMLALDDGGVWVLQPRDAEGRIYGGDGTLIGRVGRRGQGPGEFTFPDGIGWWRGSMDTVWISDGFAGRIYLFSTNGEFIRAERSPPVEYQQDLRITRPMAFPEIGGALGLATYRPGLNEWGHFPLLRYDASSGTVLHEVGVVERTTAVLIRWQGEAIATGVHPISDAPVITYAPTGSQVVIVDRTVPEVGTIGEVRITSLSPSGDTLWDRRFSYRPDQVRHEEIAPIIEARLDAFQQFVRLEGRLSERDAVQAYHASVQVPEFRPPISTALVDASGMVWIEWSGDEALPDSWWIIGSDGEPAGTLNLPPGTDVRAVGERFLWAVETDALDVPYLIRYRVQRGSD